MAKQTCASCGNLKATLKCGLCESSICKSCTRFLEPEQFSFLARIPAELSHSAYCEPCFGEKIAPAIEAYELKISQAREIAVFHKTQSKETRLLKRIEQPVHVIDCPDYDQSILRLAFGAVNAGCNSIIDVELTAKKIKTGSRQTSIWSGSGMPANVRPSQLVQDRSIWHNPN